MHKKFISILLALSILFVPIHVIPKPRLMACAGAMSWPAFATMAALNIITTLFPVGKVTVIMDDLTKGQGWVNAVAKITQVGIEKVASTNMVEMAWTVVDIIIAFLPVGAGWRTAKLILIIPKLVAAL